MTNVNLQNFHEIKKKNTTQHRIENKIRYQMHLLVFDKNTENENYFAKGYFKKLQQNFLLYKSYKWQIITKNEI